MHILARSDRFRRRPRARSLRALALLAALAAAAAPVRADSDSDTSVFGQSASEAAFVGMLYDLKQTQDHKPSYVNPGTYSTIIDEFLSTGWDESVLNRYYRVTKPLYTTQIFIPNMNADRAPAAFGAEKMVRPSRWVIHYKAQVSAPEPGTYRFWGIADDVMAAAVNGKTVIVGNRFDTRLPRTNWHSSERDGAHAGDGNLKAGDWFTLGPNEIIDLDVIIGERPGGVFNAFLMIEKQGASYQTDRRGHVILPIFQVAPYDTPRTRDADFATGFPPWKCYQ
ncbi:MAG: hypothetical protein WDO13_13625, partial [Verrucomicrobiota bacterium]